MTTCNTDLLTAYVDGCLAPDEAARMEAHLARCPECARVVQEHRAVKRLLAASAARVAVPAGLHARMASALDAEPAPAPRWARPRSWWQRGIPLTVAAVVTSVGLWYTQTRPEPVDVAAIVAVHRHAYQPPQGQTLRTADRSTARAWLRARLGEDAIAPPLRLPLNAVGACHVGDDPAAIWIYGGARPVTLIEVFARETPPDWPRGGGRADIAAGSYGGYHSLIWVSGGHTYAVVSTLPPEEMAGYLEGSP